MAHRTAHAYTAICLGLGTNVPTLVLFTPGAAITHITTLDQLNKLIASGAVFTVPLDGTNGHRHPI